eukprot:TRINITY_DN1446_c0_g1_i3.p1 TRINITY_DN1446_c0_g1~~TRINITY_DN1446_c0_g1_i3.p1  ORF type:complete len:281 (-),score=67.73 TRINITY_DN1446_c0_g1_i3:173-919(-)
MNELLQRTKVKEVATIKNLHIVQTTDLISSALKMLASYGITSAPVFDSSKNRFVGFVDTLDLASFVVLMYKENSKSHPHLYNPQELAAAFHLPVSTLINASGRDPFWPIDGNESLATLIGAFLTGGLHRTPVKVDGEVVGIVSQSDAVRFLHKHPSAMNAFRDKTVAELGFTSCDRPLVTVSSESTLSDAFALIVQHRISGLPVVNPRNGKIINNISASDLKGISELSFFRLEAQLFQIFDYQDKVCD